MSRSIHKLSARTVSTAAAGRHGDGGGLYLVVTPAGSRKWVFRFAWCGIQRDMGLGALRDISLAKARERAADARSILADGLNPLEQRRKQRETPTFGEVADELIASMRLSWKSAKHADQWEMTLRVYAAPIRNIAVDAVSTEDILKILRPIWSTIPETASRLRGRIERVFDAAKAQDFRNGENPARWRGHLSAILPARNKLTRRHHKAMAFEAVPACLASLRDTPCMSNLALEFTILTAARTGETRFALLSEIDIQRKLWTIPAARMKEGRPHRVPLCDRAIDLIAAAHELSPNGSLLFPGAKQDEPLPKTAFEMALHRVDKTKCTVHGFRSSFRDWVGELTHFPREIAEAALSHAFGDETERAYRRGDALEKRRALMDAWAKYCSAETTNVVRLAG
jgi:integrase